MNQNFNMWFSLEIFNKRSSVEIYKKREQLKSKRFKWVCYWWRWWFPTSGWYIVHYRLWNWLKKICAHGQRDRLTGLFLQSPQLDFQNQAVVSLEQWEHGSVRPSVPVLQFHHRLVATSCRPATSPCSRPPCAPRHPSHSPLHPVLLPAARVRWRNDKPIWKLNIIQQRSSKSGLGGVFLVILLILAVLGHRESIRWYKTASMVA